MGAGARRPSVSGSTSGAKASQIPVSTRHGNKKQPAPFACPALMPPPSSSTADTARPTCAADGSAWGIALHGRCIVRAAGGFVATGEWQPGLGRHVGWRCALAPHGRRGQRGRSESIVEFDLGVSKVDDDEQATGAGPLDGRGARTPAGAIGAGHVNELPLCRRSRSCRAAPSRALSLVKPRQRKHVTNAGAMLEVRVCPGCLTG
eukprot:scaffold2310_cov53-Phaeocystis_antarctica.AAC.2